MKRTTIQRMSLRLTTLAFMMATLSMLASDALAQRGGGARQWMTNTRLIQLDRIQKELELSEDQIEELNSTEKEDAKDGDSAAAEERPNFREMSAEQRTAYIEKRRKASEDRRTAAEEKLEDVLLPHQLRRLEQIKIQLLGSSAFQDKDVSEQLKLTDETREEMKKVVEERRNEMRDLMREAFMSRDREAIEETMGDMRASIEEAMIDVLSDEQKAKLKELQGPPISFTPESLMGDFFRGMGGGRDRGDRGGRDRGGRDRRDRGDSDNGDSDSDNDNG